jgi:hypothetical protein
MRRTLLLSLALVIAACGGSSSDTTDLIIPGPEGGAATFFLTESDIVTRFSADGPAWEIDEAPDAAVVAGGDFFFFEPSEGGASAGYQEFSFIAAGEGSTTITLVSGSGETLTFTAEVG